MSKAQTFTEYDDVRGVRRERQREKKRKKMDQGKRLKLLLQLILRKSEEAKTRAA